MKPALVLGLALAANAMGTDSELFGFAVPQGKLGELARKYPGMIMYDEVADDELAAVLASRSRFPSDEDYKKYLFQMRTHMDDAADEELALKYVHLPHLPVPEVTAYDDDELFMGIRPNINNEDAFCGRYRYAFKTEKEYHKFCEKIIDDYKRTEIRNQRIWGDDELLIRPLVPHITADDELLIRPLVPHIAANDDELFRGYPPIENFKSYEDWLKFTRKMSEETDNELRIRPISVLPTAEPVAFDDELRIRPISVLPTAEPVAFDDELSFMPIPPKTFINRDWIKPARIPTSEALLRDDEADDELAYLGQLINERPFARTFDDDELRAERPSHLKALEMTQMKSELPKMKRKFRPIIDEAPLAQI